MTDKSLFSANNCLHVLILTWAATSTGNLYTPVEMAGLFSGGDMGFWVVLFIIIVILGALNGGDSFGDTISKGIGCVLTIVAIGVLIVFALALFE